jgi:NADH dehydrogenase
MTTADKRVTIFGGSGFIGRYLVRRLAAEGWVVRLAVRDPVAAAFLKTAGGVGQIVPMRCNVRDDEAVGVAVSGTAAVVNLVGVLYESGKQRFDALHAEAPARIARAAAAAGVSRVVHVSAIGADPNSEVKYARTKGLGELGMRREFPTASILRPSLVVGAEDQFFNRFASMARLLPVLPLIGGGRSRFQPAYVGDVAEAIHRVLDDPATAGKTYELGGPRIYTLRELMELMLQVIGRRRYLMSIPFGLAEFQAIFLQLLPVPPLTRDQVRMLEHDNVVTATMPTFQDLGLQPQAIEAILPTYLDIYRRGGRFSTRSVA